MSELVVSRKGKQVEQRQSICIWVVQLVLAAAVLCTAYGYLHGLWLLKGDVEAKIDVKIQQAALESAECALEYERNMCHPSDRVPALDAKCGEWAICMNREAPVLIDKSYVAAETAGQTFNVFLEQFDIRAFIAIVGTFWIVLVRWC